MANGMENGGAPTPGNKSFDKTVLAYVQGVNNRMMPLTGVRYSDVYKSLHGEMAALDSVRQAMEDEIEPQAFADDVIRRFGFEVGPGNPEATLKNQALCAIAEYCNEAEWLLGSGGVAYRTDDTGTAYLRPAVDRANGSSGFVILHHEGIVADVFGRIEDGSEPAVFGPERDIELVVDSYDARPVARATQGM